jgi:glycosyltransferase involved in cell wall biosynthesis
VAYPGGAVEEVVDDAGVIVEDGNVTALGHAVSRLARDAEARGSLAERGRRRAMAFDLAIATADLAREYRLAAAEGR